MTHKLGESFQTKYINKINWKRWFEGEGPYGKPSRTNSLMNVIV